MPDLLNRALELDLAIVALENLFDIHKDVLARNSGYLARTSQYLHALSNEEYLGGSFQTNQRKRN